MYRKNIQIPCDIIEQILFYNGWEYSIEEYTKLMKCESLLLNRDKSKEEDWFHTGKTKNTIDRQQKHLYDTYSLLRAISTPDRFIKQLNSDMCHNMYTTDIYEMSRGVDYTRIRFPDLSIDELISIREIYIGCESIHRTSLLSMCLSDEHFKVWCKQLYTNKIENEPDETKYRTIPYRGRPNNHLYGNGLQYEPLSWRLITFKGNGHPDIIKDIYI